MRQSRSSGSARDEGGNVLIHSDAIANERLTLNRAGQVALTLKTRYRDGTTHMVMSPLEFMQRLAAPRPRARIEHMGRKPTLATRAIVNTGRSRIRVPSRRHLC